ncbi:MAG: UDP-3-O-acyl-N-acetylglucosamine deacetylase, partial [Alphaproteobacteria bacterium]
AVGIVTLSAPRRAIEVLKSVVIETDKGVVELHPYDRGLALEVEIDFDNPLIGRQSASLELSPSSFRKNVARARTFGFMDDVAKLWAANRALGASLDNTVVLAEDRVLNPEGLRYADEFVRHKLLDAIGDLALVGAPLLGRFRSYRGGHRLNLALVRALLADRSAYRIVEPVVRRERGHADLGLATAAYLPDMN